MQVTDLSGLVDNWTKEIEEIIEIVEQWHGATIYIDINQNDIENSKIYQDIMIKWNDFKKNIESRLKGLRKKIVNCLNKIYKQAMEKLQAYKVLADLANFSGDLGAVVKAIKSIGSFFLATYTELYETTLAIIELTTKVIDLTSKLAQLSVPKIVLRDNTTISLSPPKWEPITLKDITEGTSTEIV